MTMISNGAVVVRAEEAETLGGGEFPVAVRLLADSHSTGGAMSTQRVTLGRGADGATPHRHAASSELFFVLEGGAQILVGTEVLTLRAGDLAVVPPQLPHAFAAPRDAAADLLIVITPGVERFEYFRLLARLQRDEATVEDLLAVQERYDTHFLGSPEWLAAREV